MLQGMISINKEILTHTHVCLMVTQRVAYSRHRSTNEAWGIIDINVFLQLLDYDMMKELNEPEAH